ncbi:MAG TPA: DUF4038 domain-containing protein [Candidatus Limnocylindrales bacterium]|nr:DUF4038 domain-containing protein [Candidatus Limnocylindrales bacterium]
MISFLALGFLFPLPLGLIQIAILQYLFDCQNTLPFMRLIAQLSAAWRLPSTLLLVSALAAGFLTQVASSAEFPLQTSANHRFLVDQQNRPFIVVGDTPWSLIVQPEPAGVDRYLQDRQRRGFNAIIVNLIEHKFCTHPPKTRAGLAPFDPPGDFSKPNPDYFDYAHQVIQKANDHGIVVWVAPAYLGYGGGDEGFFREMKAGGKEKLRAYGQFVGRRFRDLPNIVWLLGGDYTPDPADRWTVTELANALEQEDTNHLMTVHASPENSAASLFGHERWLRLNTVYSYQSNLFQPVLAEYAREPIRPFVLIESTYEGEHGSKPDQIRRQAYWTMLGGGCGQFLGNNPIWHFDGPGLFPAPVTWEQALGQEGSRDMAHLGTLFRQIPWDKLIPEENHEIVVEGYGKDISTALTARTEDRRLSMTYFPSTGTQPREFKIDIRQFAGPVAMRWFNPVGGAFKLPGEADARLASGQHQLRTPGDNGAGANDWVLVLEGRNASMN